MKYRRFGRTNWQVSEIGYGMWGMAGWTGSDDEQSLASMQLAIDHGCTFFDTAWGYGSGHSESLLGQIVRANPEKNFLQLLKFRPRILSGLASVISHWMIVFLPTISRNMSPAA